VAGRAGVAARAAVALVVTAAATTGCGAGSDPGAPEAAAPAPTMTRAPAARAPAVPPLCDRLRTRVVGRVGAPAGELSGLVRSGDGGFWAHNDSGDTPRLLRLANDGAVRQQVAVAGAEHVDWEDIAIRGQTLYIGDIGDNAAQRPEIAVYAVSETSTTATKIALRYPDGPHDAEALLVDPRDGTIVIVTKDFAGPAGVYAGRGLRRAGTLKDLGPITAGDVSADGRTIALRSYDTAYVWTRRGRESLARALKRKPCVAAVNLAPEGQGEALALSRDGRTFWTVPEGTRPALRRYGR
jgi:hypothetical protein